MSDFDSRADGRQHRRVSSPAAVSTGTPSLLRKVRASAASRFPTQCETLSLLRKVMAVRKAAVKGPQREKTQTDALMRCEKGTSRVSTAQCKHGRLTVRIFTKRRAHKHTINALPRVRTYFITRTRVCYAMCYAVCYVVCYAICYAMLYFEPIQ